MAEPRDRHLPSAICHLPSRRNDMQDYYEPKVGDRAPDFRLPSTRGGKELGLKDFKGKDVILYFYPKDDTPGCTAEACNFRDHESDLAKEHAYRSEEHTSELHPRVD